jgi:1-acyl-sn-glycerol-3-phosphate acyltransferase
VAANHVGYLDILAVGLTSPGSFLVKSEIAGWPLFGALARWTGGVFVERDRPRESRQLVQEVARRLDRGDRVLLFPEAGVSPDGMTLGSFRPMLFEACVSTGKPVVVAAIRYTRPTETRVWAWIDEPSLWSHLWERVLPAAGVEVEVRFGEPLRPLPGEGRKELAARAEKEVRGILDEAGLRVEPLGPIRRGTEGHERPSA